MEHWARAGTHVPKSCGFQPACEMQIVRSASARAKLRAITGKCGHRAVCSYTPRLALTLWHWGIPCPLPHPSRELSIPTAPASADQTLPLTRCGSALHLCHGLGNLGPEKGDEGGVCPLLRGLQSTCPLPAGHGTISHLAGQPGSCPTTSGSTLYDLLSCVIPQLWGEAGACTLCTLLAWGDPSQPVWVPFAVGHGVPAARGPEILL